MAPRVFNWKRFEQTLGESIREIGILVFVFAPLDALFAEPRVGVAGLTAITAFAVGMIIAGIIVAAAQ